jgi:hypothetical protein
MCGRCGATVCGLGVSPQAWRREYDLVAFNDTSGFVFLGPARAPIIPRRADEAAVRVFV